MLPQVIENSAAMMYNVFINNYYKKE